MERPAERLGLWPGYGVAAQQGRWSLAVLTGRQAGIVSGATMAMALVKVEKATPGSRRAASLWHRRKPEERKGLLVLFPGTAMESKGFLPLGNLGGSKKGTNSRL